MGTFSIWHWLIVLTMFYLPLAIGNYFVAERMGRNRVVWVVLTLIPFVSFVFLYYVMFSVVVYILDRLNEIGARRSAQA